MSVGKDTTPYGTMSAASKLFVCLCAVFVLCLLLGDVIGGKTISTPLGPISVGILPFPVTFLLTDVVNDFYGRRGARFLTLLGFGAAVGAWLVLQVGTALPIDQSTYFTQGEFSKIFGGSSQLFVASMIAYLVGQFLDIYVFQFWKALTRSKHLWLRATGSTILSQAVDTIVINEIFWNWTARREQGWIVAKMAREYGIKVVVAIFLTPVIYALHAIIVRRFRIDPEVHDGHEGPSLEGATKIRQAP
ncbi:MAG: queuosine precursor transporter [Polyangiaceae bacterium]